MNDGPVPREQKCPMRIKQTGPGQIVGTESAMDGELLLRPPCHPLQDCTCHQTGELVTNDDTLQSVY